MSRWTVFAILTAAVILRPAPTHAAPPTRVEGPAEEKDNDKDKQTLQALLAAHNRVRAEEKLDPLSLDPKLTAAAVVQARDMAAHGKLSHEGSDGSTPVDRIKRHEYHYVAIGENVAEGYRTVDALMKGWMNSPPHRENILGKFTQVGFAVARDADNTPYWCADFGKPIPKLDPDVAADDLVNALNKERASANLPPFKANARLNEAAVKIAQSYARSDSQERKDQGVDLAEQIKGVGYRYRKLGESIAMGQPAPADVVKTWASSPDSKSQILGDFTEVGVGYARSRVDTPVWCLLLATPAGD